ncbi:MAG TPA: DUF3147 family protein [Candidatus Dormibacteraeota bacterium]|nr:DUF3147 family protein [Candidatus Dormibacteraeota bacterium]
MKVLERDGPPRPRVDVPALKKHRVSDYVTRFAFGAGISAAAAIVSLVLGVKVGGVLLGFPAILPASLTLIERKEGRDEATVDALAAILGSVALVVFAVIAGLALTRFSGLVALLLAAAAWLVVALALYVSILWLPRRRKRPVKIAKPTIT